MMLGPVSSENAGAGSGIGRVRAFSLVIRACWCWRGGVVSAVRARGLPGGSPYLLQDAGVCLLEVVEGLEEASLDAGHVLLCEVGTREHSAPKQLWPNRGRHNAFPLLGLGGKGCSRCVHSADVVEVELSSPVLAEAQ